MRLAILALLLVASTSSADDGQRSGPSKGPTRIVKFATGHTAVESEGGIDHVVVKDMDGKVTSESWCDAGTFDNYFALFKKLKEALARGDRKAVTKLVGYPFRVNAPKPLVLRNDESLSKSYDEVFTTKVLERIGRAEPAAVFCRNGAGMLGDGVMWATVSAGSAVATVLNQ